MIESADAFSHDPLDNKPSLDSTNLQRPSFLKSNQFSAQAHLYPIDESDDYHDPFSDLSLFLSKKIKQEIDKHGSTKHWSSKIENHLIAGILPEFKVKFPKYRLGVNAVKKVWEKVSYYYDKIQGHSEAIKEDGKLNIEFMIKENLKGYPFVAASSLPPYHTAHQIAVKMSECIAALDGDKPKLEDLTKTIWAVQKHLVGQLSSQDSKNAYEDYDGLDKFIVKVVLEKIALHPFISQKDLQEQVLNDIQEQRLLLKKFSCGDSYSQLAILLAKRLFASLNYHTTCSSLEKIALESFIKKQQQIALKHGLSAIESSQRILALYPLRSCLPKKISQEDAYHLIKVFYEAVFKNKTAPCLSSHPGLVAIIQAEMHFLKRKEIFKNLKKVQEFIVETLMYLHSLPSWREDLSEEIEVLYWTFYENSSCVFNSNEITFFKDHIKQALFECPTPSFKMVLYQIQDCLKKNKLLLLKNKPEEEAIFQDSLKNKIYLWSIQHEMLCRWLRFDESTPLLKLIDQLWKQKSALSHAEFMDKVLCAYLKTNTHLNRDLDLLKMRLGVIYKYYWYHHLASAQESSFDRFLKYHYLDLASSYPEKNVEELSTLIQHRVEKMLPLTPLSKKHLLKLIS
jgi:hypothetical protein